MVNKLITTGRADINAVEMVSFFMQVAVYIVTLCMSFQDHATPLHYAAKHGRTSIARILIKRKANVDAQNIVRYFCFTDTYYVTAILRNIALHYILFH